MTFPLFQSRNMMSWTSLRINKIHEFADMFEPILREIMPEMKLSIPKHLESRVAEFRKYSCYAFPIAVIKEAMEKGDFYTENCTPPMVMVIEE